METVDTKQLEQSKKIKSIINFIFRIIFLPIIFLFICASYFKSVFSLCVLYILYGGEFLIFEKNSQDSIKDYLKKSIELYNKKST